MNLRETILESHSRQTTDRVICWVGNSQKRFDELVELTLRDVPMVQQRAAWPMSEIAKVHPALALKHAGLLVRHLDTPGLHNGVTRNILRLFSFAEIPANIEGELMTKCFDMISNPAEKVGIKAFAISILEKLTKKYPEIRQELQQIIRERWDTETAAFRSRGKKILQT